MSYNPNNPNGSATSANSAPVVTPSAADTPTVAAPSEDVQVSEADGGNDTPAPTVNIEFEF